MGVRFSVEAKIPADAIGGSVFMAEGNKRI